MLPALIYVVSPLTPEEEHQLQLLEVEGMMYGYHTLTHDKLLRYPELSTKIGISSKNVIES